MHLSSYIYKKIFQKTQKIYNLRENNFSVKWLCSIKVCAMVQIVRSYNIMDEVQVYSEVIYKSPTRVI